MLSLTRKKSKMSKLMANNAPSPKDTLDQGADSDDDKGQKRASSTPNRRKKTAESESGNEKKSKFFGEYWSQEPSSGSDEGDDDAPGLAVTPGRALEGLIKEHGERPMTVGRPSIIGQRTLSGRKLDDNAENESMHQKPASPKGRAASGGRVISSEESEDDMSSPEKSGLLHTLVPNNSGGLKQVSSKLAQDINRTLGHYKSAPERHTAQREDDGMTDDESPASTARSYAAQQQERRRAEQEADSYTASLGKRGAGDPASSRLIKPIAGGARGQATGSVGGIGGTRLPPKLLLPTQTQGAQRRFDGAQNVYDITDSEDESSDEGGAAPGRATGAGMHASSAMLDEREASSATETLARTIKVLGSGSAKTNPDLMDDVGDSDAEDSATARGNPDTLKRIQIAHTKHAGFDLGGVDNFDTFMRAVDKSVSKTAKLEQRYGGMMDRPLGLKSSASSRPESRSGASRPLSSSRSRPISSSSSSMSRPASRGINMPGANFLDGGRGSERGADANSSPRPNQPKFKPSYVHEVPQRTDPKSVPLSVRRQQLANLEGSPGQARPSSSAGRRAAGSNAGAGAGVGTRLGTGGGNSRESTRLTEQMEEIEMFRMESEKKAKLEREQQELLNKLKRETARKESKKKKNEQELERLWTEQEAKAQQEYAQAKEIERLKAELQAREAREKAQMEELERLRKNVSERARADVEGATAFDKLVSDKASFLIVAGEREVWNSAGNTPVTGGSGGGHFGAGGGPGGKAPMAKGERMPPSGHLPTLSKGDAEGAGAGAGGSQPQEGLKRGLSSTNVNKPPRSGASRSNSAMAGHSSRPGTGATVASIRPGTGNTIASAISRDEAGGANDLSEAARQVKKDIRKGSKPLKKSGLSLAIPDSPDYRATVNSPKFGSDPPSAVSGASTPTTYGGGKSLRTGGVPVHVASAKPSKEDPNVAKAKAEARKAAEAEIVRRARDARPTQMVKSEMARRASDHEQELWDAVEEGRRKVELREAKKVLKEVEVGRRAVRARSQSRDSRERGSSRGSSRGSTRGEEKERGSAGDRGVRGEGSREPNANGSGIKTDPRLLAELADFEEAERREKVQEEYIKQLQFEREAKLKNEEARRRALKQLRGENREIDGIIESSEQKSLSNMREADMLSVLREENRQKDELATRLREERDRVTKLQQEREKEIRKLNKEVEGASNAEAIQIMQVERLRKIQEDTKRMMEEQEAELARLKKDLNEKVDNREEALELERLRKEYREREEAQKRQRDEVEKERLALERSIQMQNDLAAERERILNEKAERDAAEKYLRELTAKEEKELVRLNVEVQERRDEVERLHKLNEEAKARGEEQSEVLKQQYDRLVAERQQLAKQEQAIVQERIDLERLNREREEELAKMDRLVQQKMELDKTERMIKQKEQEALRKKEEAERQRLRDQEDRLREQLEHETNKAMLKNEIVKKKRKQGLNSLSSKLGSSAIAEDQDDEDGATPSISNLESLDTRSQRIDEWVSGTVSNSGSAAKSGKAASRKSGAGGRGGAAPSIAITADDTALGDEITVDGSQTDRSDGDAGDYSGRGIPTVWKMARHGKIRDLESLLTQENVDERDGKGNTCLHHACMRNKKRVAKMLLRLKADINSQNNAGNTCLHYAFGYGYDELGEYLISKGADEAILNNIGATCREVTGGGGVTAREEQGDL